MKALKIHIRYKGKALCGAKKQTRKLKFAEHDGDATCERCKNAAAK
jgi:hypothetical protein